MAPLSVSTSATMSPRFTSSPGCLSHRMSVPASMSAPSEGMRKSDICASRSRQRAPAATTRWIAARIVAGCGTAASSRCFG